MKETANSQEKRNREQGFTLIEVMVAVVILMFGLLAVGSMQISAIRGNFMGGNTSMALSLVSDKMEDLLNQDYSNADLTAGDHGPESISKEGVVGASGLFRRSWTITNETDPTAKSVVLTVTWENNRHRVSISSLKNQIVY